MIPLADRMRPKTLKDYIGQKHILAEDKLLFKSLLSGNLFSMILWGPPGVGKTTLARIIANELKTEFIEFSAVSTGIAEIKKLFEEFHKQKIHQHLAKDQLEFVYSENSIFSREEKVPNFPSSVSNHLKSKSLRNSKSSQNSNPPIIFIDEIHRFNKAQQDAFLPYVENGTIILIGATTENPSFEVISPLLSRTRVLVLNPLSKEELALIVNLSLKDKVNGLGEHKLSLKKAAREFLIEASGGDARVMLNTLEISANMAVVDSESRVNKKAVITQELIEEAFQKKALMYDKAGEEHYNTISAFIKSMRASNVDAALYYLARMVEAGEDPLFIARRMVIFASEDIGMAQPTALVLANEVFKACETIGYPECQINLAHGVTYLASAKKDRASHDAYFEALDDVRAFGNLPIPMDLRNAPTKLMKEVGYGKDYKMYTDKNLLPDKLQRRQYYSTKKT